MTNSNQKDAYFLKEKDGQYGPFFFGNVDGFAVSVSFTKDGKAKISSGDQFNIAAPKTNDYGEYYSFIFNKRWWFGNKGTSQYGAYFKLRAGKEAEVAEDDEALNAPAKVYEARPAPNGRGNGRGSPAPKPKPVAAAVGAAVGGVSKPNLPTPNRYGRGAKTTNDIPQ